MSVDPETGGVSADSSSRTRDHQTLPHNPGTFFLITQLACTLLIEIKACISSVGSSYENLGPPGQFANSKSVDVELALDPGLPRAWDCSHAAARANWHFRNNIQSQHEHRINWANDHIVL